MEETSSWLNPRPSEAKVKKVIQVLKMVKGSSLDGSLPVDEVEQLMCKLLGCDRHELDRKFPFFNSDAKAFSLLSQQEMVSHICAMPGVTPERVDALWGDVQAALA